MRLVDGCWAGVGVGIGGLLGVRVFGWKGVGNLGIGKVELIWTPGRRPADLGYGDHLLPTETKQAGRPS